MGKAIRSTLFVVGALSEAEHNVSVPNCLLTQLPKCEPKQNLKVVLNLVTNYKLTFPPKVHMRMYFHVLRIFIA